MLPTSTHLTACSQVESDYYDRLSSKCSQERAAKQRLWTWGNRAEARSMKLAACDEVDSINARLKARTRGYAN